MLKNNNDQQLLRAVRWSVAFIASVSVLLALSGQSIYQLVAGSSIIGAVSILVPLLFALFHWPSSSLGALLSMLFGLIGYLIFEYAIVDFVIPSLFIGIICSLLGMAVGALLQPKFRFNSANQ